MINGYWQIKNKIHNTISHVHSSTFRYYWWLTDSNYRYNWWLQIGIDSFHKYSIYIESVTRNTNYI